MATEENVSQVGAVVPARRAPPPSREARHANDSQEVWRHSDQSWQSKQRSSPSLVFYRKLSCDRGKGNILDEEYECLDFDSKLSSTEEKHYPELSTGKEIEGITNTLTSTPGTSSKASQCQLDTLEEVVDANRNGSVQCSCTLSSLNMGPDRSSPAPSPSKANRRHVRRSSLPVSMLAFHKVTQKDAARP